MARSALYEYAVLYHPTPKKDAGGNDITEPSLVIVEPGRGLFKSQKEAELKVARLIPPAYEDKLNECEVSVRPF